MNLLTLESEAAALAGYTISGSGQDATNKERAKRRINIIKSDIISRYGGKWDANYREGWLPLVPLYTTGTIEVVQNSNEVIGTSTAWTASMKGYKILIGDSYYKIASVVDGTTLVLTSACQAPSASGVGYQIWKDEYCLYPEVLTVGGFTDYTFPRNLSETWPKNMKSSYPKPISAQMSPVYTVVGRERYTATYSTGSLSGTANTNILTGLGTSWLANIKPGYEVVIGVYTYHVMRVNSDTELELYQLIVQAITPTVYVARGKNALIVRFSSPSTQKVVNYWYWSKDYPMLNDFDEDWVLESYPKVVLNGMLYYDYMDKNDPIRTDRSSMAYENSIKDMKVAIDNAYTGPRTVALDIPDEARD